MHKDRGTFCVTLGCSLHCGIPVDSRARAERNDALCVIVLSSWRAARATWLRAAVVSLPALLSLSLSLSRSLSCALSISLYHSRTNSGKSHPSLRSLALAALARSLSVRLSRRQCSRTRNRILCNNTPANVNIELYSLPSRSRLSSRFSIEPRALLSRARSIDREELLLQRAADIGVRQWRI